MEIIYTLQQIDAVAQQILKQAAGKTVFAFDATMGAGKTTLINALCKQLQVADETSSPTYSIANEYNGKIDGKAIKICHMDWYRLKDANDVLNTGVVDYFYEKNAFCFIEWSSVAKEILPLHFIKITIEILDNEQRKLVML